MDRVSIPTEDDVLTGAWWKRDALTPFCTWSFDRVTRELTTRRDAWRRHRETMPAWHGGTATRRVDRGASRDRRHAVTQTVTQPDSSRLFDTPFATWSIRG
jgi:hypothetical protein